MIIVWLLEFPTGGQQTFVYTGSDAPAVLMLPSRTVGNYNLFNFLCYPFGFKGQGECSDFTQDNKDCIQLNVIRIINTSTTSSVLYRDN